MYWTYILILILIIEVLCKPDDKNKQIVIIGAGASGIAAASKLLENGFLNITILEAENRYGGRIYNEYEDNFYKAFGAEWTHANPNNIVYKLVKESNAINKDWTPKSGIYASSDGEELTFESLYPYIVLVQRSIRELINSTETLTDFYKRKFNEIKDNKFDEGLARIIPKMLNESILGGDWDKETGQNMINIQQKSGVPIQPIRGMKTVLDIMMKIYPETILNEQWNKILKLGKKVTNIKWNSPKPFVNYVDVNNKQENFIEPDHVIVTVPLGVLKTNHDLFEPKLPKEKLDVINMFKFGTENNMYLKFEKKWWPENRDLFIVWTQDDAQSLSLADKWLSKIEGFVPVDNSTGTLAVHNMELDESSSEGLSDEELSNKLMTLLRKAFGNKGWNITDPIKVEHSRWQSNPNFRGSSIFIGPDAYKAGITNENLKKPLLNAEGTPILVFAGEITSKDNNLHFVEGAINSGFYAANTIME